MGGMPHVHDHADHGHAAGGHARSESALLLAFALTSTTMLVEIVGGWLSGSLALLADAAHMLVDAGALFFAWLGARLARRPADARRSFGYARLEVLVGYSNSLTQFALSAWIVVEAVQRLRAPEPILSGLMLAVAVIGLAVNLFVLRVLGGHGHDDVNTAAARLHVVGDLLGSIAAVAAALAVGAFGWLWADPLLSIAVAVLILFGAQRLLRRSAHILLEGTPAGMDAGHVAAILRAEAEGVDDAHHIHVWQLAGGYHLATLHVRPAPGADPVRVAQATRRVLRQHFDIGHATIELEESDCQQPDCGR